MSARQYKVTGMIDEQGNEIPDPVIVTATSSATAKLEAANKVGGYWNEDTEVEQIDKPDVKSLLAKLTTNQLRVFEQIAVGNDSGHHQRTLDSLEQLGLVKSEERTLSGHPPVTIKRYSVPLPVHIHWCQWCAETVEDGELN